MEHKENILVSAEEAFESTKQPQFENLVAEINRQRLDGHTHMVSENKEKLHMETLRKLLAKGYDLSVTKKSTGPGRIPEWVNGVFWDENASGAIRKIENVGEAEWPELYHLFATVGVIHRET